MSKEKSLVKNSIFNIVKIFSIQIFPIISFAYASRILGDTGIGRVNFTRSVISYFSMIAVLGVKYYGIREAAKLRDDKDAVCARDADHQWVYDHPFLLPVFRCNVEDPQITGI